MSSTQLWHMRAYGTYGVVALRSCRAITDVSAYDAEHPDQPAEHLGATYIVVPFELSPTDPQSCAERARLQKASYLRS
jgi:hypothetical protein